MVEVSTTAPNPCVAAVSTATIIGSTTGSRSYSVSINPLRSGNTASGGRGAEPPAARSGAPLAGAVVANEFYGGGGGPPSSTHHPPSADRPPVANDYGRSIRTPKKRRPRSSTGISEADTLALVDGWEIAARHGWAFDRGGLWITIRWKGTRSAKLTPAAATTRFIRRLREKLVREAGGRRVDMIILAVHEQSEENGLHTHILLRVSGIPADVPIDLLIRWHAQAVDDDAVHIDRVNDRGVLVYMVKGTFMDRLDLEELLRPMTAGERKILDTKPRDQGVVPGNRVSISTGLREPQTDWTHERLPAWALDAA